MTRHRRTTTVDVDGGALAITMDGTGEPVILHPSLGRWAADFDQLSTALADDGFMAVAVDPRGVGDSHAPLEDLSMTMLAEDLARVVETVAGGVAHLVGHAFGNRVVRHLASRRPEAIRTSVLLGAGGMFPGDADARAAIANAFDLQLPVAQRLEQVSTAFFAPGNDPSVWLDGWFPDAFRAQSRAMQGVALEDWWEGGSAPMLVVVGLQDRLSPPDNARSLVRERRAPTELVEIDGAGHALLPERPGELAAAVVAFLRRHRAGHRSEPEPGGRQGRAQP